MKKQDKLIIIWPKGTSDKLIFAVSIFCDPET